MTKQDTLNYRPSLQMPLRESSMRIGLAIVYDSSWTIIGSLATATLCCSFLLTNLRSWFFAHSDWIIAGCAVGGVASGMCVGVLSRGTRIACPVSIVAGVILVPAGAFAFANVAGHVVLANPELTRAL